MMIIAFIFSLTLLLGIGNHPELVWETIETEHFFIHFHKETERSAREAAIVAEKVYGPITSLYQFEPDSKTHIIIKDTDDIANGAAYFYDNKIEIWAMPLDFDLRGSHRWIQNVITHEFVHIVQVQASMKFGRKFPATYLQWIGYEKEKRDDVLYGYPNTIISTPLSSVIVPPWFAEGTAQFMYENANFDYWDSHRDMILRDRVLNDNLLSFNDMNTFGKRGIGNESTYNQGFSLVKFLVDRYGSKVLRDISNDLAKPFNFSIYKAIKNTTGESAENIYYEWKTYLQDNYFPLLDQINENKYEGIILEQKGTTNIHPIWSPDESRFAFLSNKQNDYFSQTDMFVYDFKDSSSKKIVSGVSYAPFWYSDSIIFYSKKSKPNKKGSKYFDIYKYNLNNKKEERLTENQRTISPIITKNDKIFAITTYDGTSNIVESKLDSIVFKPLTSFSNGTQIFSLSYDSKNNDIIFDAVEHNTRNIYKISLGNKNITKTQLDFDSRDPYCHGGYTYYSSDQTGIYNLYSNGKSITNVIGGAFMPHISLKGKLLYSLYDNGQYKIALIENINNSSNLPINDNVTHLESSLYDFGLNKISSNYEESMPSPFFFPRIMYDYNTIKPGFYFYSGEILNKFSLISGASVNSRLDLDLILSFEYRRLKPTIYCNIFGVTRNKKNIEPGSEFSSQYGDTELKLDLLFSLFETNIGITFPFYGQKLWLEYVYQKYRQRQTQNISSIQQDVNVVGKLAFDYYKGHIIKLKGLFSTKKPEFAGNMLPSNGFKINYDLSYEYNKFMADLNFDSGVIRTNFNLNNTFRFIIDAQKNVTLNKSKKIVSSVNTKIGLISNDEIDDFFHFFGGGMPGIKGYTFYDSTLTGPYLFVNSVSMRWPLILEENIKFLNLNLQNMSLGGVFQAGGAFNDDLYDWIYKKKYKLSAGIELRLSGYSFYAYPIAVSYELHKPINDDTEPLKSYFSILFDF